MQGIFLKREQLKHQELGQLLKKPQEGESREYEEGVLGVAAFVVGILLLLEANEGKAIVLPSDSG